MFQLKCLYKNPIALICYLCLFSFNGFSQNWLNGEGGATNDEALDIAVDPTGDYYTTGYFTTTATFGTFSLNSAGNSDVFIAKYNAAGIVQWAVKAGGSGADRGYSIKTDDAGNLYITGYYYGTATFGATTISSVGSTQDVFIAKYDISGNMLWVRSVGGTDAETGYGITSDNLGNVIATGQFKGTATFGTITLSSAINPLSGLPSFDIFTVKYDGSGNFLWVEQGRAKYDDRGLDVAVDLSNNIFIVGQFSDTIQFDAIHNNAVMNSGYLMKYDQTGNEQWFVKMSAVQTILYSIAVDQANNILITGDFKGNLGIFTTPMVYSTSPFTYKIFIAKFTNAGAVLWVDNDGSDSEVTSKSIALDANGDAYITGLFKCKFDEYSQTLGTGIFYSSGYRDVFITKYSSSGARQWFRHFGSNKDDYCSGIAVNTIDKPVIAGSFENRFNVPYASGFTIFPSNVPTSGGSGYTYCGYSNYQSWVAQETAGQKDIFVTSPVDMAQAPFDYFVRPGSSSCFQDFIEPCIGICQDTIDACGSAILFANPFEIDTNYIGAQYNYVWSTGATTPYTGTLSASGNYTLLSSREDGCFQNIDTVYLAIHPIPAAPWITDSYSINVNKPPNTLPIAVCGPDTITLWGTNANIADSVFWTGPAFININDSTIIVTQSGEYDFVITTQFGCSNFNEIDIDIQDTLQIYPVIDPYIVFLDSTLQATDTITICIGTPIGAMLIDSGYYAINGGAIPNKITKWKIVPAGGVSPSASSPSNSPVGITIPATGWYTLYDTIVGYTNLCGSDTSKFPISRSFYVIVNPKPLISLNLTGPANPCPGDSVFIIGTSSVNPFYWSTGDTTNAFIDTLEVLAPSIADIPYQISAFYTDTITGCSNSAYDNFILIARPYPVVTISPVDGIICPNDSVLLTCEPGLNYYWISPSGDSIGTTQSIYVSVPGFYYCIHTAFDGCIQTSNFVEAKEYNTPYLVVEPGNFICANGSAIISVQASNTALIQWQPPLSGSATTQTVTSGGTYICEITDCGVTTIDSVVIVQSTTLSLITALDSVICPGDTLILTANPGMVAYEWISTTSTDPVLYVTTPGTYILQTTDFDGCFGFSEPFVVTALPQAIAPSASDTTICAGQSISIFASGPGAIAWYASATGGSTINVGTSYTTPVISNTTTYYLQTLDSVCNSPIADVTINVYTSSVYPSFSGDTTLCVGDSLGFLADSAGVNYSWTGPGGFSGTLQSISISPVSFLNEGYYTLQYSDAMCASPIDSFYVAINALPTPTISPDSTIYICTGTTTVLTIDSTYSSYSWFPGAETTQSITVGSNGTFYAMVNQNGCVGISNSVTVSLNNPLLDPTTSDITVCSGSSATLTASGSGILTWFDASLSSAGTGTTFTISFVDSTSVYFVQSVDTAGCSSQMVQVTVFVFQDSIPPIIYSTSPACVGDDIYLSTDPVVGATYSWTGPGGYTSSLFSPTIFSAQLSDIGMYQLVVSLAGCSTPTGITNVVVYPIPIIPAMSGNLIYCEEDSLHLEVTVPDSSATYYWMSPFGSSSSDSSYFDFAPLALTDSGAYYFAVIINGCFNDTTITISINPKPQATAFSNDPICVDDTLQFYADTVSGGTYYWTGPGGFISTDQSNLILNANSSMSGNYQLVTTLNGCTSDSSSLNILVVDFPIIDLGLDTAFCSGTTVIFTLPSVYSYLWNDGSTGDTYVASDSGMVGVIASAGPGCTAVDSVLVDDYFCLANVPNIITPNGDGINDYLYFNTEGIREVDVTIYDRWGVIIYHWTELNGYWDGNDLKNTPVVAGVYFYTANIKGYDNKIQGYRGFVHVER